MSWDESYALTEVNASGAWAYAIAQLVSGPSVQGVIPHTVVPLIGVYKFGDWQIVMPSADNAAEFNALLRDLPANLMDEATKAYLEQPAPRDPFGIANALNFGGHKLPWLKGQPGWAFSKDNPGHVNQVDFDIQGLAAPGDVLASKSGVVVFVKQGSSAGACSFSAWKQANMVVVQNGASEYTWYVHLAPNSVPLRAGDTVSQGSKVGVEGATGYVCGTHVHMMVSAKPATWTNPNDPNDAPWPNTNDLAPVDFVEVSWAALQNGQTYISQNDGAPPPPPPCPAPTLQTPNNNFVAPSQALSFTWAGVGNCVFNGYTLRIKTTIDMASGGTVVAEANTTELSRTQTLSTTWNYRDLYWSVRANGDGAAWATARRLRIEPTITGTYSLYSDTNFLGDVLTSNQTISDLQTVNKNDWARSLKLDPGVGTVACTDSNMHGECSRAVGPAQFTNLDMLAQGLNGNLSSIRVCGGECPPGPPAPTLQSPLTNQRVLSGTALVLTWNSNGDGLSYWGELSGGALTSTRPFGWITETQYIAGILPPSDQPYAWRLRASNGFGDSAWVTATFLVVATREIRLPILMRDP